MELLGQRSRLQTANGIAEAIRDKDWEFVGADTQYLTHNLHRYSGKFIPQIARQAIELLTNPGELVLDPYVGSGTTLLEAALAGRQSVGIDFNPLAVLIASAKIQPIGAAVLAHLGHHFRGIVAHLERATQPSLIPPDPAMVALVDGARSDERLQHPWYSKWFQEHVLFELIVLHRAIQAWPDLACKNLAMVAFSDILRRCSNAHTGYPNVMFDRHAPKRALSARHFLKSLQDCISMVSQLQADVFAQNPAQVIPGDAAAVPVGDDSVDAVVSHPPYIGSIPYAEYGALSLVWLGVDPKELDHRLTGGRRQAKDVVERFAHGYQGMLSEAFRVLRPRRRMFLLVGNPVVRGDTIDLGQLTKDLATGVGFTLVAEARREGVNRRANKMGNEVLLFFEKANRWV